MQTKIGIISGYFNPLHTGHLDYIEAAKARCDILLVIVNNDRQVVTKGSKKFMDENSRVRIVNSLKAVDRAILSIDEGPDVTQTLSNIYFSYINKKYKFIFMNGGDRKADNTPEMDFCMNNCIEMLFGIGGDKTESSSRILGQYS